MSSANAHFILGIDTSCDETSMAVYDSTSQRTLSNVVSSQIKTHARFGGIVPEVASRAHMENILLVYHAALKEAGIAEKDLCAVAVTSRPGLMGCLLVGCGFAKGLSYQLGIPLIGVNHLEAHLFSPYIGSTPQFPFLGLVVSGGHTAFYKVSDFDQVDLLGQTVDDAAGEAFDKCAKMLGLGYPGGPIVDQLAQQGNEAAFVFKEAKVKMGPQYLSFSGLKTAVQTAIKNCGDDLQNKQNDLCASLQAIISKTLCNKALYFLEEHQLSSLALSGGVAMNSRLRSDIKQFGKSKGVTTFIAEPAYCTDNGAMVAYLASHRQGEDQKMNLTVKPNQKIQARRLKK
ncbi:MAG: tRNA (adenosine(37)-N6)-threonylcarbamoyltransferase complex transferase subunit TsaD [Deltaproteobacteria bacterium]|nr:tRNA (adenosine(37)-N6)-threonylcarbamoyltransferase complex transferase subunit TsaD [Deltaproteobacteria bacterium]